MDGEFTAAIQLGALPDQGGTRLFEVDLLELTRLLERPLSELRGGRSPPIVNEEMS